jgi:hypothetical protein
MLAQMINPANTFPMLLRSAQDLQQQQLTETASTAEQTTTNGDAEQQQLGQLGSSNSSSSSILGRQRPQQLLTVGCRHWGNGLVQGMGLKVKIYDFAIYLDDQQVRGSK